MTMLNSERGNENVTPVNDRIAHMLFGSPYPRAHWLRRVGRFFLAAWWAWLIAAGVLGLLFMGCATVRRLGPQEVQVSEALGAPIVALVQRVAGRDTAAVTLPLPGGRSVTIHFKDAAADPCLRIHEQCHREDIAGMGDKYRAEYAKQYAEYGYLDMPLERHCRERQEQCAAGLGAMLEKAP